MPQYSTVAAPVRARAIHRLPAAFALVVVIAATCVFGPSAARADGCGNAAARTQQNVQFLPDCRAYEMVSPLDKNGNDVVTSAGWTQAAVTGDAAKFTALAPFGDAPGGSLVSEFVARRSAEPGTSGWQTHGITPSTAKAPTYKQLAAGGFFSSYADDLSPDLTTGIFRPFETLTPDPLIGGVPNLYLRRDLDKPGPGTYDLLSLCPACTSPLTYTVDDPSTNLNVFTGASADYSHVFFESAFALTAGSPDNRLPKLYESSDQGLRVAGVLPDSACGAPPCVAATSIAGSDRTVAGYGLRSVSADGSRVEFMAPNHVDPAAPGTVTDVYLRVNGQETVQIDKSERTIGAAAPHLPSTFQTASRDLGYIYFSSDEALTDDAQGSGSRLYRYSVVPDAQGHHLTFIAPAFDAIVGQASDDGSTVYFMTTDRLSPGDPINPGFNLWINRWRQGTIKFVATAANKDDNLNGTRDRVRFGQQARVSPDGDTVLLAVSQGAPTIAGQRGNCPGNNYPDTGHCINLYLWSAQTGHGICLSCTSAVETSDALDQRQDVRGVMGYNAYLAHSLSDDGSRAFFDTSEALVPGDTNGKLDVYEYDAAAGQVHLVSSGQGDDDSHFLDASPSGDDVFFATRDRLTGWDTDENYDVYDARVGGGLPEPVPATSCAGDACQAAPHAAQDRVTPASSLVSGQGNPTPHRAAQATKPKPKPKPKRCRRGYARHKTKKGVRCVKKPTHKARVFSNKKGR
jgi:hypothetical protein